mmetsp:Transcript_11992/g.21272  ORF Transcript_11992/g.21272 Transcript_11992/m.21272 type:complete len:84 (-) Transcript_11992:473-724(-)
MAETRALDPDSSSTAVSAAPEGRTALLNTLSSSTLSALHAERTGLHPALARFELLQALSNIPSVQPARPLDSHPVSLPSAMEQ